jgi:hypothetical protein
MVGVPPAVLTITVSENDAVTTTEPPTPNVPFALVDVTEVTVGWIFS